MTLHHPTIIYLIAFLYNCFKKNNAWRYNNIKCKGAFLSNVKFNIHGKNNKIQIGEKARLKNCKVFIQGNNCQLTIGSGSTIISNTIFFLQDNNCKVIIGNNFTMEGGHIAATESEAIIIGNDCMFSDDIEIRNGDSHSIIKQGTEKRINWARSINIGNHVWLTAHVRVLKGSNIPDNSIIANSSVVTSKLEYSNSIYGGCPAKLLKRDVDWDRNRYKFKK